MNKYILPLAIVTAMTSSTAQALIIDDFSDGPIGVEADNPGIFTVSTAALVFGHQRTISISKEGAGNAKADVIAPPGFYTHSSDASTTATSIIAWSDASGVDLTSNLQDNAFSLDIFDIDQGNIQFILSITDDNAITDQASLLNASAGIQNISFSSFSAVNLQKITAISLTIIGGEASDLVINSLSTEHISAVPTPASVVLFSSSLALLSLSRRKTKATNVSPL